MRESRAPFERTFKISCLVAVIIFEVLAIWCCTSIYLADRNVGGGHTAAYLSKRGYAKCLGVDGFETEDFLAAYGEPERRVGRLDRENQRTLTVMEYPGFSLLCVTTYDFDHPEWNADLRLSAVRITDRTYRFGDAQIGVSSTREDIHTAYENDVSCHADVLEGCRTDWELPLAEGYAGDDWSGILFCYDGAGVVTDMIYERPSN